MRPGDHSRHQGPPVGCFTPAHWEGGLDTGAGGGAQGDGGADAGGSGAGGEQQQQQQQQPVGSKTPRQPRRDAAAAAGRSKNNGAETAACLRGEGPPPEASARHSGRRSSAGVGGAAGMPSQHGADGGVAALLSARDRSKSGSSASNGSCQGVRVQSVADYRDVYGAWRESTAWEIRAPSAKGDAPLVRRNPILHETDVFVVNEEGIPEKRFSAPPHRIVVEQYRPRPRSALIGATSGFPSGVGLGGVQAGRPRSAQHNRRKGVCEFADLRRPTQPNWNRHYKAALDQNRKVFHRRKGYCGNVMDAAHRNPTGKKVFENTRFPPQPSEKSPSPRGPVASSPALRGEEGGLNKIPRPPAGKASGQTPRQPPGSASARGSSAPGSGGRRYIPAASPRPNTPGGGGPKATPRPGAAAPAQKAEG